VKQEEEELKELDAWWKDAFIENGDLYIND